MKRHIPLILIISRLVIGFVIIALALFPIDNHRSIIIALLTIGLLTDIFDGIVARRLGIATQKIRRLDSSVDQVFFVSVGIAAYIRCPVFFQEKAVMLIILLSTEALTYLVSYLKFKKEIATHSIGAKIWTLILFATLVQIIWKCESGIIFFICFWIGVITRLEIVAIILILKNWTNDVPSVYHAMQLRKGNNINRNKMFN
jgi:phosphatidylglycerophosphate synthase